MTLGHCCKCFKVDLASFGWYIQRMSLGRRLKGIFDCAVDEGRLDAGVEVEPKKLRSIGRKVKASEQGVAKFVGNLVPQERGIHLSQGVLKICPAELLGI